MTGEPWSVRFTRRADKDMERLDLPVRRRVVTAIQRLVDEDPRADVRRLSGSDEQRLRVGDWRIRFNRNTAEREIIVLRILPRGRAYDR